MGDNNKAYKKYSKNPKYTKTQKKLTLTLINALVKK